MTRIAAGFIVLFFASSCAEDNSLTGSIGQSHDLAFDAVQLRLLTAQQRYELRYLKEQEGGVEDTVAKLVFDRPLDGVVLGEEIDLLAQNVRVERLTAANDPFPASLQRGVCTFSAGGNDDGDDSVGAFATTFDNGATLNGGFRAPLQAVDF